MRLKNLRASEPFDALAARIKDLAGTREVIYAPNGGNWGDGLIHCGTGQFLAAHGVDHVTRYRPEIEALVKEGGAALEPLRSSVLIAGGGGSWSRNYFRSRGFVGSVAPYFHHVVVMPTSFDRGPVAPENVTYIRRDLKESAESIPASIFCHDMAFFIDLEIEAPEAAGSDGSFFRGDRERNPNATRGKGNVDLSRRGNDRSDVTRFFATIAGYERVFTDRLHVAVAASMLGRHCHLHAGNYWKNGSVYTSSIAPNYDSCTWVEW